MSELSYSCLKATLRYFSVEKRAKLVEKFPQLRQINKLLPYRIHNLYADGCYGNMTIKFDNYTWKFHHFETLGTHRMVTPAGKKYDLETLPHHVDMDDFLRFYLDREGTVVMSFTLDNFGHKLVFDTMLHRTNSINVLYSRKLDVESFSQFSNFPRIPEVKVFNKKRPNDWLCDNLKKLSVEVLSIINTIRVDDDVYLTLSPLKKIDYYEQDFSFMKLKNYCMKLQYQMTHLLGSSYAGDFSLEEAEFEEQKKQFVEEMGIRQPVTSYRFHLPTLNPNVQLTGSWHTPVYGSHRVIIHICNNVLRNWFF